MKYEGSMRERGNRVALAQGMTHLAALAAMAAVTFTDVRDARACGACFVSSSESTVVSDHRMALSLSMTQTVLWDQITYEGNPKEFAYVIPVRAGTRVETSNDAWFAALDASTRPIIMGPRPASFGGGGGGGGGGYSGGYGADGTSVAQGEGGGCGCGSTSSLALGSDFSSDAGVSGADGATAGGATPSPPPVQVVAQDVVGSYETVTLRSIDPNALFDWLVANGFDVPDAARPIIGDYVREGLDFLAMRLRPTASVRAMEPIRIVTPGADATLPLRMMRIGAGTNLGITLFVLGEGRYHPQNFPDAVIDPAKLIWDAAKQQSNYQKLSLEVMATNDGKTWLTEYAKPPSLIPTGSLGPSGGVMGNPGLADAYVSACPASLPFVAEDAGAFLHDAAADVADTGTDDGASDASPLDAGLGDAADDAAITDAGLPDHIADDSGQGTATDAGPPRVRTRRCDDLELALLGVQQKDAFLVRMRAFLPNAAMDTPLELEPGPTQTQVDNVFQTTQLGTVTAGLRMPEDPRGTYAVIAAALFALWSLLRRRHTLPRS
jgi:hypothetical protein